MELETICRYKLPIVILVFNNNGIYHGDTPGTAPPSPTGFIQNARYDKLIEAFGGVGYNVEDTCRLAKYLEAALAARRPALINCAIDPTAGTESGHIQSFNPRSTLEQPQTQQPKRAESSNGTAAAVQTSTQGV
jgi:oxalyl-CoA decarboxylase